MVVKRLQVDNLKIMDNLKLIDNFEFEIELRIEGYLIVNSYVNLKNLCEFETEKSTFVNRRLRQIKFKIKYMQIVCTLHFIHLVC